MALAAQEDSNGPILSPSEEEPQSAEPPVEFTCKFPIVEGVAGDSFEFEFYFTPMAKKYAGKWVFNVITPPGWKATVWRSHPDQRVGAIDLGGVPGPSLNITVKAVSLPGKTPEPGEYIITIEVKSGDIKASLDLTAVVTARYELDIATVTGRLNTEVKSGEEKHASILLVNTGTATIENITLSSDKPEGWSITFNPEKIDSLEPGLKRKVDVVVKPPKRTIAGDYFTTLKAESERGSDSLELRVTVLAPRIWGWAGIGIAAAVIAGLGILFSRLSMR
jgi:uncharacterized membrane protein